MDCCALKISFDFAEESQYCIGVEMEGSDGRRRRQPSSSIEQTALFEFMGDCFCPLRTTIRI